MWSVLVERGMGRTPSCKSYWLPSWSTQTPYFFATASMISLPLRWPAALGKMPWPWFRCVGNSQCFPLAYVRYVPGFGSHGAWWQRDLWCFPCRKIQSWKCRWPKEREVLTELTASSLDTCQVPRVTLGDQNTIVQHIVFLGCSIRKHMKYYENWEWTNRQRVWQHKYVVRFGASFQNAYGFMIQLHDQSYWKSWTIWLMRGLISIRHWAGCSRS